MEKTSLGLTRLLPGEPLSSDGYAFQDRNPLIIDTLLRRALAHRHDAHPALAAPTLAPLVETVADGGTIPADTTIYVGYTLLDGDGGETTLNPEPVTITTQAGLAPPDDAPLVEHGTAAGTLVAGTYTYAISVTDDAGGETAVGPVVSIAVPPGAAQNQIILSGLQALVSAAGGVGYRLWRRFNGGQWGLISSGAGDIVYDDGSLCVDCTQTPPTTGTATTNGTNTLTVTVPGQVTDATQFRIYASVDGIFASPSMLGTYPITDLGDTKTFAALTLLDGAPPDTSLALSGAAKIDALTELTNLSWRAPVLTLGDLPDADNAIGDVRLVLGDWSLHAWDDAASAWTDITGASAGGGGHEIQDESVALPQRAALDFQGGGVTVTDDLANGKTIVTVPLASASAGGGAVAPKIIDINPIPDAPNKWPFDGWATFGTSTVPRLKEYVSESTVGAWMEWEVALEAGSWNAEVYVVAKNNQGMATVSLDGEVIAGIDAYDGSAADQDSKQSAAFAVAASGIKLLRVTVTAKNPSSSGNTLSLRYIRLTKYA